MVVKRGVTEDQAMHLLGLLCRQVDPDQSTERMTINHNGRLDLIGYELVDIAGVIFQAVCARGMA